MNLLKKKSANNIGMTLVELIVVVTILGIISGPIIYMFFDSQIQYQADSKIIASQKQINQSLQSMLDDFRNVGSPTVGGNNSIEIQTPSKFIIRYLNSGGVLQQIVYASISGKIYKYTNTSGIFVTLTSISDATIQTGRVLVDDVTDYSITNSITNYTITVSADPPDVGVKKTMEITVSTKFTPRFYNIR